MKKFLILSLISVMVSVVVCCVQTTAVNQGGGGSEVEVVGRVCFLDGEPAPFTQVKLIPAHYDPLVMNSIPDSMIDTTDQYGCYSFHNVAPDIYNVQALQLTQRTRMLVTEVEVTGDSTTIPVDTLFETGNVRILLSGGEGFVTIPGTDVSKYVAEGSTEVVLDSIPSGNIPEIRYVAVDGTIAAVRRNVSVEPSQTTDLSNILWDYSQSIVLNTSISGAGVSNDVYNFPVLVRLSKNNFDFSQTNNDGTDLCFTKTNGIPLVFEIEQWDAVSGYAAIWVRVDTVYGDNNTQQIIMHWGNSTAAGLSDSYAVFDTANGFQGVWHLNDGSDARDATGNKYHGNSPDTAQPATGKGIIGNCCIFDGTSDYISMPNTAESKLNFEENSQYTISAWVLLDTFDNASHCIVSKGYQQYFLRSTYFPTNSPSWEFVEFGSIVNWQVSISPASEKQWVMLTGVRQGSRQFLYCNDLLVDSTVDNWTQGFTRNTTENLSIGRFLSEVTFPTYDGYCFFKGSIDEVRICSEVKTADYIKLCYMNQRSDDRLVNFIQQ